MGKVGAFGLCLISALGAMERGDDKSLVRRISFSTLPRYLAQRLTRSPRAESAPNSPGRSSLSQSHSVVHLVDSVGEKSSSSILDEQEEYVGWDFGSHPEPPAPPSGKKISSSSSWSSWSVHSSSEDLSGGGSSYNQTIDLNSEGLGATARSPESFLADVHDGGLRRLVLNAMERRLPDDALTDRLKSLLQMRDQDGFYEFYNEHRADRAAIYDMLEEFSSKYVEQARHLSDVVAGFIGTEATFIGVLLEILEKSEEQGDED